jgi:hypothetical protein
MRFKRKKAFVLALAAVGLSMIGSAQPTCAQVNPVEIVNPRLKAAQSAYFSQIKTLYQEINSAKFPFTFALARHVGLDPSRQAEADSRGIEFVFFHDRMLLKISGSYNAAFSAERLTQNERASRTFSDVIEPSLALVSKTIPADVDCDGIGFEVSFHVRTRNQNFDFEGKEILVVVFDRADAFAFAGASTDSQRQEILNRSEVYLDGKEFGLALGGKEPLDLETRSRLSSSQAKATSGPASSPASSPAGSTRVSPIPLPPEMRLQTHSEIAGLPAGPAPAAKPVGATAPSPPTISPGDSPPSATATDANDLQAHYQTQLDALAKLGLDKFHFVSYAPPSFVVYRSQVMLQLTLRNTIHFSPDSTSLYKRAAQSFDLFLAGQLKDILDKIPEDAPFARYDITVLNQFGTDAHSSSEAIEFICPRIALRRFVDADITNQQLIDQSVVLVNGVRIALNLQLVE